MIEATRPAEPGDIPRLAELLAVAVAETAGHRGGDLLTRSVAGEDPAALSAWLDGYRSTPGRRLLAGTIDGCVVGVAALRSPGEGEVGSFDVLYVEAEARGVGLGASLVDLGIEWFRQAGCVGVDVAALPGRRDTKQFLEGAGLVARLIVMHRRI